MDCSVQMRRWRMVPGCPERVSLADIGYAPYLTGLDHPRLQFLGQLPACFRIVRPPEQAATVTNAGLNRVLNEPQYFSIAHPQCPSCVRLSTVFKVISEEQGRRKHIVEKVTAL